VEIEQVLTLIDSVTFQQTGRSLSDAETALLKGAWADESYQEIADRSGYSINYLQRDIGPKFWKRLSDFFSRKINKTNLRSVLTTENLVSAAFATLSLTESGSLLDSPTEPHPTDFPSDLSTDSTVDFTVDVPLDALAAVPTGALPSPRPAQEYPKTEPKTEPKTDWGEAIDVSIFYGRMTELELLTTWMECDRCRVIALLGMGGIGKSALAAKVAQEMQPKFEYVIWRSLRNAIPLESLLCELVSFLSNQKMIQADLRQLLECLRSARCLVILDNLETILEGAQVGRFRPGYEGYGELLRICGESTHQSCLLLTSRETPGEISTFEGEGLAVRSLRLSGDPEAAMALLQSTDLVGNATEQWHLCDRYGHSPLALKIVIASIRDLFGGRIPDFLAQDIMVFNGVRRLLEQQFQRLSETEQTLMHWLALNRDLTTLQELREDLVPTVPAAVVLTAVEDLLRRSLIEKSGGQFTQQSVVMEYVIEQLIETLTQEIDRTEIHLLNRYVLVKAQAKSYLRATQKRLVLFPLLTTLQAEMGSEPLILRLKHLLQLHQQRSSLEPGYAASNLLSLLEGLGCDLTGYDFSNLAVWQACLTNVSLHQVNFAKSDLSRSTFAQAFGSVLSVTFNPMGDRFATVDDHGEIQVWDLGTQQSLLTLSGHTNWVWTIAFSPDGKFLASGSHDQTIRIWHLGDRQCVQILRGHQNWVWSVAFSPDGKFLVSGSWDTTIRLWDVATGDCVQVFQGHEGWVRSVCFSPKGDRIASASQDGTVRLWHPQTGECQQIFHGHEGQIWSVVFSPDGLRLASSGDDQTVRLWHVATGTSLQVLRGHHGAIRMVAFSRDGQWLASGGEDNRICLWQGQTGQHCRTLAEHTSQVWTLSFHPTRPCLVSGSGDQTVRFWDVETGQCLQIIQGHASQTWSIAFAPPRSSHSADRQTGALSQTTPLHLVSGHGDHQVRLWDASTGHCLRTFHGHRNWVWSVAFSPDGELIASSSGDQTIRLWQVRSGDCVRILRGHENWVWSVAFSADGQTLVSSSSDRTVRVWEVDTGLCLHVLSGHGSQVRSVAVHPQRLVIASSGGDRTIRLWEGEQGHCLRVFTDHEDWVWSVAFDRTGNCLASGSGDRTIRLWDWQTGHCWAVLTGHTSPVRAVTFSQEGNQLISSGEDGTVRLWDLATQTCLQVLQGHQNWVWSVAVSDNWIASSSADETIRLWDRQTGTCLRTLQADRPYEGMNITGVTGISESQKSILKSLGAIETFAIKTSIAGYNDT
jgi:WD40 repeat protein